MFAGEAVSSLGAYLAERCEADVKEHEMWFRVAKLSVESDFAEGKVVFKTITKEMLDRLISFHLRSNSIDPEVAEDEAGCNNAPHEQGHDEHLVARRMVERGEEH
jgi:hypothetical protein